MLRLQSKLHTHGFCCQKSYLQTLNHSNLNLFCCRCLSAEMLNKGNKRNLRNALQQQLQSTCIVLEAAVRQTSASDEPAVLLPILLTLVNAIGCAATPHAQQYLPVAAADAATTSSAASAASAAHVFSLMLTCTKLAQILRSDVPLRIVLKLAQMPMTLLHVSKHHTIVPDLLRAAVEIQTPEGYQNYIRVWLPTSGSGSFTCTTADSTSRGSRSSDEPALDVTAIAPVAPHRAQFVLLREGSGG